MTQQYAGRDYQCFEYMHGGRGTTLGWAAKGTVVCALGLAMFKGEEAATAQDRTVQYMLLVSNIKTGSQALTRHTHGQGARRSQGPSTGRLL